MKFQKKHLWPLTAIAVATAAVAGTLILLTDPVTVSSTSSTNAFKA